jgi:release factor glutamine methyltransferase
MPENEKWTVGRLLQWTADYLKRYGADTPRLEAEVLLAEAMNCPRIALYTSFDDEPKEDVRTAFRALVKKRAEGVPVAYLVGRREFYSMSFRVTPDVLVPRPETEFLVVALIDLAKQAGDNAAICDVGTGSGIIAVCAAKHAPKSRVTAIDISPAALAVARENAAQHGVADRIAFVQSDLLAAIPADAQFDCIASNPPYVREDEFAALARDVRDHEPRLALVAGPRGVEVIERLIEQADRHLKPGGHLLIEVSPMIHNAVCAIFQANSHFAMEPTIKDLARLPRVVHARRTAET